MPNQLSGGQRQRVALARALVGGARAGVARRAARRARPQAASGDAARAQAPAARGRHHVRLRHPRPGRGARDVGPHRDHGPGRVHQVGTPEEVYHEPATAFVARFVGKTNLIECDRRRRDARGRRGISRACAVPSRTSLRPLGAAGGAAAGGRSRLRQPARRVSRRRSTRAPKSSSVSAPPGTCQRTRPRSARSRRASSPARLGRRRRRRRQGETLVAAMEAAQRTRHERRASAPRSGWQRCWRCRRSSGWRCSSSCRTWSWSSTALDQPDLRGRADLHARQLQPGDPGRQGADAAAAVVPDRWRPLRSPR